MNVMMTQTDIANYFKSKYGTKIDQGRISNMLRGEEKVSWPFAGDLAKEFPDRTILQWKNATTEELSHAFDLLPEQALTNPSNEEAA